MNTKRNTLLLVLILLTTTFTFAQRKKVTLKQPGKKPFITYETDQALIFFEKEAVVNAYAPVEKTTLEGQLFDEAVGRYQKTGKTIRITDNNVDSRTKEQQLFGMIIEKKLAAQLLTAGNAAVTNKKTGKPAASVEYEVTGPRFMFYLPGDASIFFWGYNMDKVKTWIEDYGREEEPVATIEAVEMEVPISMNVEGTSNDQPVAAEAADKDQIFTVVEQSPEYPGGMEALKEYINRNLKKTARCEGAVFISFIVNTDGTLTEHTVLKGLDPACDQEAMRVTKGMPAWKPGKQNGRTVKSRYVLPVRFKTQ